MKELFQMKSGFKAHVKKDNDDKSLQDVIEEQMHEIVNLGHYESVFLFDQQGLQLAHYTPDEKIEEFRVIEISLMIMEINKTVKDLAGITDLKEIMVEGKNGRKIIFRFIPFYGQTSIFVAVIPAHKTYRALTNRLQRAINKLGTIQDTSI